MSVQEVLNRLERLTEYTFLYKMDLLEGCGKVDVDVRNEDFGAVLRSVLEPWNLTYRLEDKVVVLMPRPQLQAQELAKKLTGKVTDEEGMPLPGVTVLIKGTQLGTATDADGKYELTVPQGGVALVFTMVGMETREVTIGT